MDNEGPQPGRPQVILRVKRRREEPPVELLVLEADAAATGGKRSRRTERIDALSSRLAALGTEAPEEGDDVGSTEDKEKRGQKRRFVFTRVDTVDAEEAQHGGRVVMPRGALGRPDADYREVRRFRSTSMTGGYPAGGTGRAPGRAYHLIDLALRKQPGAAAAGEQSNQSQAAAASEAAASVSAAPKRPHYIFRPQERELDEAIFRSFQEPKAIKSLLEAIAKGADINFQRRNADDTTALMAVAYQGDVAAVARLLRMGGNPCLRDVNGKTALDMARDRKHHACEVMLSQAIAERDDGSEEEDGYVFDVYSVQMSAPQAQAQDADCPLVHVEGLTFEEGTADEPVLVFEDDSEYSGEEDDDDADSNAENYYANDYPDTESEGVQGDEEGDSDDEGVNVDVESAVQRHLGGGMLGFRKGPSVGTHLGPFTLESDSDDDDDMMMRGSCCIDRFEAYDSELDMEEED